MVLLSVTMLVLLFGTKDWQCQMSLENRSASRKCSPLEEDLPICIPIRLARLRHPELFV